MEKVILNVIGLVGIWLTVLSWFVWKNSTRRGVSFKKGDAAGLSDVLLAALQTQVKDIQVKQARLDKRMDFSLNQVGFVRFNPFNDTGGDQSFVLALLDSQNNGVVLSSLHSRERTRMYAKPITNGLAPEGYTFSKEEEEAIKQARQKK